MEFVKELPPKAARGRKSPIVPLVEELKLRPGEWARVKTGLRSEPNSRPWKALGCEATTRRNGAGTMDLYARWPVEDVNGGGEPVF